VNDRVILLCKRLIDIVTFETRFFDQDVQLDVYIDDPMITQSLNLPFSLKSLTREMKENSISEMIIFNYKVNDENKEIKLLFSLKYYEENQKQIQDFKNFCHLTFSSLELELSLFQLIPQVLPQIIPLKFGKIVFQKCEPIASVSPLYSQPVVWTSPGTISSIEYLLCILRLSHSSPTIFLSISPMLRQQVSFLTH
jgi:hypothetical protein